MSDYKEVAKGYFHCFDHNKTFLISDGCPICNKTLISTGNTNLLKKDINKDFTSNSQAITSKSQAVTFVKRHYIKKNKDSLYERFHNLGLKLDATIMWDLINVQPTRLNNNVCYKRLDFSEAIVKVFRKSILLTLRKSKDIKDLDVESAFNRSMSIVNDVLSRLPKSIVVSNKSIVSMHNAFVNHPIAKHFKNMKVYDSKGNLRFITDHSKGFDEGEFTNKNFVIQDSKKEEDRIRDQCENDIDLPSVTKYKIDTILNVQMDYAENIKKHLLVQDETLLTLKAIRDNLNISKLDKIKKLKEDFGW